MILRNPDWDWYKLNSSCHILFASCKYRHSTLQLRPRLFLTFGVELEIMNGLAWLLSVIRYKVIACKKNPTQSWRFERKFLLVLGLLVLALSPLSGLCGEFGLKFTFFVTFWLYWGSFVITSMKLDGKTNWWLRTWDLRLEGTLCKLATCNDLQATHSSAKREERSYTCNSQEKDNIYIFTVCQF